MALPPDAYTPSMTLKYVEVKREDVRLSGMKPYSAEPWEEVISVMAFFSWMSQSYSWEKNTRIDMIWRTKITATGKRLALPPYYADRPVSM